MLPSGISSIKEALRHFCVHTTGHGFFKIAQSDRIFSSIWAFITLAAFVGGVTHLSFMVLRYGEEKTNTEYHIGSGNHDFQFPDITLCSGMRIFAFDEKSYGSLYVVPDLQVTYQVLFNRSTEFWKTIMKDDSTKLKARYTTNREGHSSNLYRSHLAYVFNCKVGSHTCSFSDMHEFRSPKHGRCLQLSPSDLLKRDIDEFDRQSVNRVTLEIFIGHMGTSDSLETDLRDGNEITTYESGMFAYLHPHGTVPTSSDQFIVISRSVGANVQVQMVRESFENTKRKPCMDYNRTLTIMNGEQPLEVLYTRKLCLDLTKQEFVFQKCGCLSEELPIEVGMRSWPFCHAFLDRSLLSDSLRFAELMAAARNNASDPVVRTLRRQASCHKQGLAEAEMAMNKAPPKKCQVKCLRVYYQTTMVQRTWPLKNELRLVASGGDTLPPGTIKESMEDWIERLNTTDLRFLVPQLQTVTDNLQTTDNRKFCRLDVAASSNKAIEIIEKLVYPEVNLLSDLGGIFGLWLGFSLITICEVMEVFVESILLLFSKKSAVSNIEQMTNVSSSKSSNGDSAKASQSSVVEQRI